MDGSIRDYIYVEDAVSAYLCMAKGLDDAGVAGEAFNFSREEPLTVLEVYEQVCLSLTGGYVEPEVLDIATHEIHNQFLSSHKARENTWLAVGVLDHGWSASNGGLVQRLS